MTHRCVDVGCRKPVAYLVTARIDGGDEHVLPFCYRDYWHFRADLPEVPGTIIHTWANNARQEIAVSRVEEVKTSELIDAVSPK